MGTPSLATGRRVLHRDIESAVVDEMLEELTMRKRRLDHRRGAQQSDAQAQQTKFVTPAAAAARAAVAQASAARQYADSAAARAAARGIPSPGLDPATSPSRRTLAGYPRRSPGSAAAGTPRSTETRRLFVDGTDDEDDDVDLEPSPGTVALPLTVSRIRLRMEHMQEENARLRLDLERRRLRQERLEEQLHDENTMLAEMLDELATVSRAEVMRRRAHHFEIIELNTIQSRQHSPRASYSRGRSYSPHDSPRSASAQSAATSRLSGRAWLAEYFRDVER